jgi:uncharacterized integral membrane protein
MRYLNWALRASLFIILLGFALKNDQPATLRYFFGYEWQSTLVVIVLVFFAMGAVVGVLAMLPNLLQQRREIARLKRDLRLKTVAETSAPGVVKNVADGTVDGI